MKQQKYKENVARTFGAKKRDEKQYINTKYPNGKG